jgi:hypothetical protein
MSEFHDRLIERARALGADNVRIEHGGSRASGRRFRRHPHITGEINGEPFKFPIKARPRDASARFRYACLRSLTACLRKTRSLSPRQNALPAIQPTSKEKDTTMRTTTQNRSLPWLVVAVIGDFMRDAGGSVLLNTIVMAERATEAEAVLERDRRNSRNDGRWYFVLRADEYKPLR